jgi:hypothetical protein
MRTPGGEVARGRQHSLFDRGLPEALATDRVAALVCCTVPGLVVISHIPRETVGPATR